jgi:hypothetical protein
MSAEENLQRMKTLDDAWNAQELGRVPETALGVYQGVLARSARPTRGLDA